MVENKSYLTPFFLLATLGVAACFLRFPQLGVFGFWGDEGYTALAVKAILEKGYPSLPSGGTYFRSVPFLYLEAAWTWIWGLNEFTLRVPAVLFNLGACGMAYLLGTKLLGKPVGLLVAVFMVFSTWEIEFSRYARMYSLFQFLFLLGVYSFYRGFIEQHQTFQKVTLLIWIISLFVHKLAISFLPLLIIPYLCGAYKKVNPHTFWGMGLVMVVCWKALEKLEILLRHTGKVQSELLENSGIHFPLALPKLTFLNHLQHDLWALGVDSILAGGLIFLILIAHPPLGEQRTLKSVFLGGVIFCGFFGQIAMGFLGLVAFSLLFFQRLEDWKERSFILTGMGLCVFACFWILYGYFNDYSIFQGVKVLFSYPKIYDRVLKYWTHEWLVETILGFGGLIILWKKFIEGDRKGSYLIMIFGVAGTILLMGIANQADDAARYSFHIYPLLLMLEAYCIVVIAEKVFSRNLVNGVLVASVVILLVFPSNMQLVYSLEPSQISYGEMIAKPMNTPGSGKGYLYHPDYKTTSEFIQKNKLPGDVVISMEEVVPYYYIGEMHYLWIPKDQERESLAMYAGTGVVRRLTFQEMLHLLQSKESQRYWILDDDLRVRKVKTHNQVKSVIGSVRSCRVYTGLDNHTSVHLVAGMDSNKIICGTL